MVPIVILGGGPLPSGRSRLWELGRQRDNSGGQPKETELNSGAFGQNRFFSLATPGQLQLDLLQVMRRDHKLDSYSLNAVSAKFLGDAKLDLPAAEIFAKFRGSDEDRADIARYAVKDTELPLRLLGRLAILENLFEMANAVSCPASYVYDRGQQVRVFSVIAKKARQLGFLCPDIPKKDDGNDEKYEGATVLDACKGAYFDVVSGLDFASLYPSIIRAHNMCYSTLLMDPKPAPPGFEVYECNGSRFVQKVQSVLPELLADLAQFRKQAKADMAAAKKTGDEFAANVFNGKQLAYKVTMNSVYGFLGATRGYLPCLPIAIAVTATGRQMIADTKRLAEDLIPGSKVIYGDTGEPR